MFSDDEITVKSGKTYYVTFERFTGYTDGDEVPYGTFKNLTAFIIDEEGKELTYKEDEIPEPDKSEIEEIMTDRCDEWLKDNG